MKHELVTGDLVLARVAGEIYPFEFYGWWDGDRRICCLVVPHNGLTILASPDQILCRATGERVIRLNLSSLKSSNSGNYISKSQEAIREASEVVCFIPHPR